MSADPHEFSEDVADGSMCVCGIPALTHDAVMAKRGPAMSAPEPTCGHPNHGEVDHDCRPFLPEPPAEHVDAVANELDCGSSRLNRSNASGLLRSTDPAVHAAMLDALVRAGVLTWQRDAREWRGDPGLIPRGRNNGVRWAARRLIGAWEPDEVAP